MRTCRQCLREKPLLEFPVTGKGYRKHVCAECVNANNRAKADPEAKRAANLLRLYGITAEEYAQRLDDQNGVCAICHRPETWIKAGRVMQLAVDHDHVTGAVRGLLCFACNAALGRAEDSIERLKSMIYYLERGGFSG